MAKGVGFPAALILKAISISLENFSCLDGKSNVQNGSRSQGRADRLSRVWIEGVITPLYGTLYIYETAQVEPTVDSRHRVLCTLSRIDCSG